MLVAIPVAGIDLAHKALAVAARGDTLAYHDRSAAWALALGAAVLVEVTAIALVGSRLVAVAGGVLLGGSAGNLLAVPLWGSVPDPIGAGAVSTNLADLSIAAGALFLLAAVVAFGWLERARLGEPVRLRPTR